MAGESHMDKFIHINNLKKRGYQNIGGLDEAGRGPLAGPVVSCCVNIKNYTSKEDVGEIKKEVVLKTAKKEVRKIVDLGMVDNSKKLSEANREELYQLILDSFDVGVGVCDNRTIDRINILEATFLSMKKAISALKKRPDYILVDGKLPISNCSIPQLPIVKGDDLVYSIAAASIVAKVTRDRIMKELDQEYPIYGFVSHKGYGTRAHMESLQKNGPCPFHRVSFAPVKKVSDLIPGQTGI